MSETLVHKGSTKDVYQAGENYLFRFSDRFSVFDWGEMPDHLNGKGVALAQFTKSVYKYLGEKGIKHHLLNEKCGPNEILVKPFEVIRDATSIKNKENVFIPLEVIFRLGVAQGSSLLKRTDRIYQEGEVFDSPMIEFTTKLERFDRPLTHIEAKDLSGLTGQEWESLLHLTKKIALELKLLFASLNITLWDGKIELALGEKIGDEREIILVDSIGPDELRLTRDGKQLSKEIIRQYYRNSDWYKHLDAVKNEHGEAFKNYISPPPALSPFFKKEVEEMYQSLSEDVTRAVTPLRVLILGSGGREHSFAWRCSQDKSTEKIFIWPGNAGISGARLENIDIEWNKDNFLAVLKDKEINFVIPGAEQFMYDGVSDWCEELHVPCFGPSKRASLLEESKLFAKNVMNEANVPTASFVDITLAFQTSIEKVSNLISDFKRPVIKISGPALGKGVFVCDNSNEALEVLSQLKEFPIPGIDGGLLVEEGLRGKEVSVFFACNGAHFSYLGSAQDYKRLLDGDKGPNTGGMGTVSPVPWVDDKFIKNVQERFLLPTLRHMASIDSPFKGVMFLGLMVEGDDMKLLEYNVRFGDPETQVLLPLIEGDFARMLFHLSQGLPTPVSRKADTAVHIVKAARGYPGAFGEMVEKGQTISTSNFPSSRSHLFFAGVKKADEKLVTNGGRVLGVTSLGPSLKEALSNAYEAISCITFPGEQFRKDIGRNL